MKKVILVILLLAFLSPMAGAEGVKLGAGVFGGLNIPIVQQDQGSGTAFGVRGKLHFSSFFGAEPNIVFGKWGDPGEVDGFELGISGSSVTSFGVDLVLGGMPGTVGFKPFVFAGLGMYSIKNDDTDYDESKFGFDGGLGVAIGLSPIIDIETRGTLFLAGMEGGLSKKAVMITAGINYYFGSDY